MLRAGHLGQVHAPRGTGKTFIAQTLSLVVAAGAEALGFRAPEPARVLYVDGEMLQDDVKERFDLLCQRLHVEYSANLTIIAADWQPEPLPRLDTEQGRAASEPWVSAADLVVLDNRSCLFDPDGEKDPNAWQPAQNWLMSLRRRGKTALVIHHSNRAGAARGHSKAEDVLDVILKLYPPEGHTADAGAHFVIEVEKLRGRPGPDVAPVLARLTTSGWEFESYTKTKNVEDKLREYVQAAAQVGERPKSANAAIGQARVGRNEGLRVWKDLVDRRVITQHADGGFYVP